MKLITILIVVLAVSSAGEAAEPVLVPEVDGEWWQVAGSPDLGKLTTPEQEPVDFAIWQTVDGTWQIWSCIRKTAEPGFTRLFFRWQGARLTDSGWTPMGISMRADTAFGENLGTMQAPYVIRRGDEFLLFYGTGNNIAVAKGADGKTFARQLRPNGTSGLFGDEILGTRDIMILKVGDLWHGYFTAHPDRKGSVYLRTSKDLWNWSAARIVAAGGVTTDGPWSAECPFVYYHEGSGYYYLFRTQSYKGPPQTSVYRSKDPTDFGINDDRYLVGTMAVAAPEIFEHDGQLYIAALLPDIQGIRIAKLKWAPKR